MIVVDANIAAKWFLPEAGSNAALALQEGPSQLVAPDLIRMEVAAAITRRVRAEKEKDRLPPDHAIERCGKWFRLLDQAIIALIPEHELLDQAVKLSVDCKHPLQDCLYLAAARQLGAPIVTADRPFHERIKPFYKKITLLAGCETN